MSLAFRLMYWLGLTPWDHGQVPEELRALVRSLPRGRALDVGCGTGTQAVWLAQEGFQVVGVDIVPRAIEQARERAHRAGVELELLVADAAAPPPELCGPFELILDFACMQAVPAAVRDGLTRSYARWAAPGATLLLFAFSAGRMARLREDEIKWRLGGDWQIREPRPDHSTPLPRLLRNAVPLWYVLQRR